MIVVRVLVNQKKRFGKARRKILLFSSVLGPLIGVASLSTLSNCSPFMSTFALIYNLIHSCNLIDKSHQPGDTGYTHYKE